MRNTGLRSPLLPLSLAAFGLVSVALPIAPASARVTYEKVTEADYQACAASLVEDGVTSTDAAIACAAALYPEDVSTCVSNIGDTGGLTPVDVLSACQRVRRPVELASCFTSIQPGDSSATAADVLDNCRRSLLPERFASCVVGLRNEVSNFTTAAALTTCIDASDTPTDVLSNFVPAGSAPPSTPELFPQDDTLPPTDNSIPPGGVIQP